MTNIVQEQGIMLCNRIQKNLKRLRSWRKQNKVSCYRLYHRDIPEIPLGIDWYEGHLHVAEYQRNHVHEACGGEVWLREVVAPVAKALQVPTQNIHYKVRDRQTGKRQYQAKGNHENQIEVHEGEHRFLVNLVDYLDTGLFLDHRKTRAMVAAQSNDKSLLNLFCYTGSFSVYAGVAGAANTLGIDLSATYLTWARANLALNGLSPERHRLRRGDVMEELLNLHHTGERFDLCVVDPPTFSNSKRLEGFFDVQHDHSELLMRVHAVLAPQGIAYFSTNHRNFTLDTKALQAYAKVEDISHKTLPSDFRDKKIHRCWRLQKDE